MKNNYYLFLLLIIGLFGFNKVNAQSCPPTGFSNGSSLYFFYDSGTSLCENRPTTVNVGASVFTLSSCDDEYSIYGLTSGDPVAPPNTFTADFGYATCEYTDGTLTNETLSIKQVEAIFNSLRLFPNPVTTGNTLNVKFQSNVSASINIYSVTGKLVLAENTDNLSVKPLSISNLPNGIYMVQITSNNLSISKKVVVMR
ncbi:T9SS type A sorting domain-containing protein [Meridianimaribacter flavus]|uniref:T9SS type A sorting domain-containing protein n=1 Tax=Gaetbulibacter sp. NE TaxID=2982307 RepID=UPI0021D0B656|nr:T9SS type A sorting domain-containing protein [Gaetbulibacter sp. NE]